MDPWIHGSAAGAAARPAAGAAAGAAASAAPACIYYVIIRGGGANYPFAYSHTGSRPPRSVSASPRLRSPLRSLLLRSNGKKICALLAACRSGCVFALELGRRASILLARTAPGTPRTSIFKAETAVFSMFSRSTSARREKRPMC